MGNPQAHPLDARVQAAKPALGARQPRVRQELAGAPTQTADGHYSRPRYAASSSRDKLELGAARKKAP